MASFFTLSSLLLCIPLLVLLQIPLYSSSAYDYHAACSNLYDCGKIRNIGFPFWGQRRPQGCGYPELYLNCSGNSTFITIKSVKYLVLDANPDNHVLRIVRLDYMHDLCPEQFLDTSLDPQVFEFAPELIYITFLYGCPSLLPPVNFGQVFCPKNGLGDEKAFALLGKNPGFLVSCNVRVVVPIEIPMSLVDAMDLSKVQGAVREGFEVKWIAGTVECEKCERSGGVCGYDWVARRTSCFSKDESSASSSVTGYATPDQSSGTSIR